MIALFGKLPAKRDFVARGVPNVVLERIEPWLQEAMAQSRETLGEAWTVHYLGAPLWRFWWSRSVCGVGTVGALMPSVDGVGRYFPLLALAFAPDGTDFPIPGLRDAAWYEAVEAALLSALVADGTLSALVDRLAHLPPPGSPVAGEAEGSLWWTVGGGDHRAAAAAWPELPPPDAFAGMLGATVALSQSATPASDHAGVRQP